MIKNLIFHVKCWNEWRLYNINGGLHKLLVLLGIQESPTLIVLKATKEK